MNTPNSKNPDPVIMAEIENDPGVVKGRARDIEMFKDYFKGMRLTEIAVKYGVSRQKVNKVKLRDKWDAISRDIRDRAYAKMSYEWKDFLGKVTFALKKDWERLTRQMSDENFMLSDKERTHGRHLLDYLCKASQAADDKPTASEATSGVVTHRVLLPEGVKRFGVIPPDSNVHQVEHKKDEKKTSKLDPSDVEDIE